MEKTTAMNEAAMTMPCRTRKPAVAHAFLEMKEAPDASSSTRRGAGNSSTPRETKASREIVVAFLHEALGTAIVGILRYTRH